jgi:glycosyltransferase involved in cell wall biosynthesis
MLYNLLDGLVAERVDTTLLCGGRHHLSGRFLAGIDPAALRVVERGGPGNRFVAEQRACLDPTLAADAVLFPNYYVPPIVPRRLGRVGVVMHDFQYRHFPRHFSARKRAWLRAAQAWAMRRADRVIAISAFVRGDAIRLFGGRVADKIAVVPNAVSWARFADSLGRPRPAPRPYILSVAAQYPHKNLETVIRAFDRLARSNRDLLLVLCGQGYAGLHGVAARRAGLGALIDELELADRVVLTGHVDDPTLAQWYRHAEMFVFPSLFEGFGMPPVEALGFGLPTLVSGTTSLPEVTRGLAHIVDRPRDAAAWAAAMAAILRAPDPFRPPPDDVERLRAFYHPARIARAYVAALAG